MTTDTYAVVEFVGENAVEVVVKNWIEKMNGELYCYWPRANAAKKLKRMEMPDKQTWKTYKIRVLTCTDTLEKAHDRARQAEVTSNLESGDDSPETRKRPHNKGSLEEFPDCSDSDEFDTDISNKRRRTHQGLKSPHYPPIKDASRSDPVLSPLMPVPPIYLSNGSGQSCSTTVTAAQNQANFNNILPGAVTTVNQMLSSSPSGDILDELTNPLVDASRTALNTDLPHSLLGDTCTDQDVYPVPNAYTGSLSGMCGASINSQTRKSTCRGSSPNLISQETPKVVKRNFSRQEQPDSFQRSVLAKLDIMIEKQSEALSIWQVLLGAAKGVGGQDMLEDVLPKPIDSPEELEKMSAGLSDEEIKKKTLHFLVALCGHSCAISIRRILGKIGTNKLWSEYSLKGRKAKRSFKRLAICTIVIKACLRVHKGIGELDVEEQIAEYLKHAPNKAGGSRYKDRKNTPNDE